MYILNFVICRLKGHFLIKHGSQEDFAKRLQITKKNNIKKQNKYSICKYKNNNSFCWMSVQVWVHCPIHKKWLYVFDIMLY